MRTISRKIKIFNLFLFVGLIITGGPELVTSGTTINWEEKTANTHPTVNDYTEIVYDVHNHVFILFGGYESSTYLDETWIYDASTNIWTNMNPTNSPPARRDHAMAYDISAGRVILFGGYDGGYMQDTWEYDYANNTWNPRLPSNPPSSRREHAMVYDEKNQNVFLFGGYTTQYDIWRYDYFSNTWTKDTAQISGYYVYSATYDILNEKMIIMRSSSSISAYDGETQVLESIGYNYLTLAYDSANQKTVGYNSYNGECWVYDYASDTWNRFVDGPTASGSYYSNKIGYDNFNHKTIVFMDDKTWELTWVDDGVTTSITGVTTTEHVTTTQTETSTQTTTQTATVVQTDTVIQRDTVTEISSVGTVTDTVTTTKSVGTVTETSTKTTSIAATTEETTVRDYGVSYPFVSAMIILPLMVVLIKLRRNHK